MADSIHITTLSQPSFRQRIRDVEMTGRNKFVRVTVDSIFNPNVVAISFELYWHAAGRTQFLGAVAPFPADYPGSFIVATDGKLAGDGQLEFRLVLLDSRDKGAPLKVLVRPLKLE
ncbi:hypothetical protein [Parapedobacter soli]|uniref:hypothetical protein n=1 Tax=Parapedobacter soli TaxID=416955 RepID=UPI0021CA0D4E|nr:hypothetical protein [Parapedobacter soli]